MSNSGDSRDKYDSSGNKYTEHFDSNGNYTGSSKDTTDWLGNRITEHFDKNGNYSSKSEKGTDGWGDNYTKHFNKNEQYTGKSEERRDGWGDKYTGHYNENGEFTGKSETKHDWLGDKYTHHTSNDNSSNSYSGSGYSSSEYSRSSNSGSSYSGSSSQGGYSSSSSRGGYSSGSFSSNDDFGTTVSAIIGIAVLIFVVGGLARCFRKAEKIDQPTYRTYSVPSNPTYRQPEPIKEDLTTVELPSNDEIVADLNNYHKDNYKDRSTVFKVKITDTRYYSTSIRTFVTVYYKTPGDKLYFSRYDAFIDYNRNNGHWNFNNVLGGITINLRRSSLVPDPPVYDRIREDIENNRFELWNDDVGELRAVQTSESSTRINDSLNVMLMPVDVMFINPAFQTRLDDKIFVKYKLYGEIWVYEEMFRTTDFDNSYSLGFYE